VREEQRALPAYLTTTRSTRGWFFFVEVIKIKDLTIIAK